LSEGVRDVSQQYGRFCMIKVPVGGEEREGWRILSSMIGALIEMNVESRMG